jgi:hypothetical protein
MIILVLIQCRVILSRDVWNETTRGAGPMSGVGREAKAEIGRAGEENTME